METIEDKYGEQAREAGVYIVFSCGFDSIPNDMGALMVQKSFNGDLTHIDSYVGLYGKKVRFDTECSENVNGCSTYTCRSASILALGSLSCIA